MPQHRVVAHTSINQAVNIYRQAMMRSAGTLFPKDHKGLKLSGTCVGAHSLKAMFVMAFKGMYRVHVCYDSKARIQGYVQSACVL